MLPAPPKGWSVQQHSKFGARKGPFGPFWAQIADNTIYCQTFMQQSVIIDIQMRQWREMVVEMRHEMRH